MSTTISRIMRSTILLTLLLTSVAAAQKAPGPDKYELKVPGGLAFAEFKGYEGWEVISVSHGGPLLAVIVGNPAMINAYKAGYPGNGKPFPDGARMAKLHYVPKKHAVFQDALVPGSLHDVDFMVKDSKRFKDSGGWGYAAFKFDSTTGRYTPQTLKDLPPQGNDARCGATCHTVAKSTDFVFTEYQPR